MHVSLYMCNDALIIQKCMSCLPCISGLSKCYLSVGEYISNRRCLSWLLKICSFLTVAVIFIFELIYSVRYVSKYNDYVIGDEYYLMREGQSRLGVCCQRFRELALPDQDAINNGNRLVQIAMGLFSIFSGGVMQSLALNFEKKGKFGAYLASLVASLSLGQFTLMQSTIRYGSACVLCSHLQLLIVPPRFYPYISLVYTVLTIALIYTYLNCQNRANNAYLYYSWWIVLGVDLLILFDLTLVGLLKNPIIKSNLVRILFDLFLIAEAYYEYCKDVEEKQNPGNMLQVDGQ